MQYSFFQAEKQKKSGKNSLIMHSTEHQLLLFLLL